MLTEYLYNIEAYDGIVIFFDEVWVELKRAGRCVVAFGGSDVKLFQQLINNTLCSAFLRKVVCQPLCCVPLQILTFYQNLVLVAEYHLGC